MSDAYREQHPLLCDELSDEERYSSLSERRYRPLLYRGRARDKIKGAAVIITKWPEHWTSTVTYWWAGLSMIAIMIFAIYNCIITLTLLPPLHAKPTIVQTSSKFDNNITSSMLPDVFMHIFVNSKEETNLDKYLPHIEKVSNQHLDFKFIVIVILNDTAYNEFNTLSAEENNEIAFNSLWTKKDIYEKQNKDKSNIYIEHIALSEYMNRSPLKKDWRHLPVQFIQFLVRAVSIWDKGGMAFDPNILKTQVDNKIYIEKIYNILHKYEKCKEPLSGGTKIKKKIDKGIEKAKKRVNNIRDIINILEHDDNSFNTSQYSLTEAENRNYPMATHNIRKLQSIVSPENKTILEAFDESTMNNKEYFSLTSNDTKHRIGTQNVTIIDVKHNDILQSTSIQDDKFAELLDNNKTNLSFMPLFLKFLFHDKSKMEIQEKDQGSPEKNTRKRKSVIPTENIKRNISIGASPLNKTTDYKPMIISAKGIINNKTEKINYTNEYFDDCDTDQLTIDLNGYLLATRTPCHAFVGTVFSNVVHHTSEETLKDFIITELSIFCKGLLSSCKGIDVILL